MHDIRKNLKGLFKATSGKSPYLLLIITLRISFSTGLSRWLVMKSYFMLFLFEEQYSSNRIRFRYDNILVERIINPVELHEEYNKL